MRLVVVGGGPAGLEITARIYGGWVSEGPERAKITPGRGSQLLGSFPKRVRELAFDR